MIRVRDTVEYDKLEKKKQPQAYWRSFGANPLLPTILS